MRGVILAAGSATRLSPASIPVSKQLLPVYDKPMIYYPLSTLMLAGIRDIMIITRPKDRVHFRKLLGDGEHLGISIQFADQEEPRGVADGIRISASFTKKEPFIFMLGDNLFYGAQLRDILTQASIYRAGATIFTYQVANPEAFGVVELDSDQKILSIKEKPKESKSNLAVTGLYIYDGRASDYVKRLEYSSRGELEITDLNALYLADNCLHMKQFSRGFTWFDTGTFENLYAASTFVRGLQERQGLIISSIEEIAWRQNWITTSELLDLASKLGENPYSDHLLRITQ